MLKAELRLQQQELVFWTDSTSLLTYIQDEDKCFHMFVANRVSAIRGATRTSQWWHVSFKENPANDASRQQVIHHDNRWIQGPKSLCKPEGDWPANVV